MSNEKGLSLINSTLFYHYYYYENYETHKSQTLANKTILSLQACVKPCYSECFFIFQLMLHEHEW